MSQSTIINPFFASRRRRTPAAPAPKQARYARLPKAPVTGSPVPHLTSLYHFDRAGEYGSRAYPGNCGGNLIKDLLRFFKPATVFDPLTGSGTCQHVCREMGIYCWSSDLHQNVDACDASQFPRECFEFAWIHPLCGAAHNGCNVAQMVMWCPTRLYGACRYRRGMDTT